MSRLTTSDVRKDLADTLNRVAFGGERIELHRHGKSVAAIVSVEDLRLLEQLEDRLDIAAAKKALREPGRVSWRKLKTELGL